MKSRQSDVVAKFEIGERRERWESFDEIFIHELTWITFFYIFFNELKKFIIKRTLMLKVTEKVLKTKSFPIDFLHDHPIYRSSLAAIKSSDS